MKTLEKPICSPHQPSANQGYSVLELCTILCIAGFLLMAGLSNFNALLMRTEREAVLTQLTSSIAYAKQEAHRRQKTLTLCASDNGNTCLSQEWSVGWMIFENNGHTRPTPAEILQVFPGIRYGRLHFERFGENLNIHPNGRTPNNGTFTYCPKDRDRRNADGLIVNKVLRTYRPKERNTAGILLRNEGTSHTMPLGCL